MPRQLVNLTLSFFLVFIASAFSHSAEISKGGTLEITVLKIYQDTPDIASFDVRFTNSSQDDIKHWGIALELYDKSGKYLARGIGQTSHIRSGESKIETIGVLRTHTAQIGSWKATLWGVVGYSGLREDRKYRMLVKKEESQ